MPTARNRTPKGFSMPHGTEPETRLSHRTPGVNAAEEERARADALDEQLLALRAWTSDGGR
jgi:hypothetical protein